MLGNARSFPQSSVTLPEKLVHDVEFVRPERMFDCSFSAVLGIIIVFLVEMLYL